ncbi:thioredoxin [Theileria orientalis]|uniref:Thioredoxin n=1 Tax=Theileria orientalis TaxID=68886 RepID=A0A976M6S7_THEOR|nr:thioredoxin [Theileria orientalis]
MVREVKTTEEFNKTLSDNPVVVVDFYADWCGPCVRFAPKFDELAEEHPNLLFIKVNVDTLQELAQKYGVTSIPAFKVFKSGQVVGEFVGANKDSLKYVKQSSN